MKPVDHKVMTKALVLAAFIAAVAAQLVAQGPQPAKGVQYSKISEAEMKEWLTYLASDDLQGRQVFTEGYGLAAQYVSDRLKEWGLKPLGANGFVSSSLSG